jgi:hypothetical protein
MTEEQFWEKTIQTFKKWRKQHPEHALKLHMISKKIEIMRLDYIKNIQEFQYRKSKTSLEKAEKIKQEAEKLFKTLSRFELLATLSK